MKTSDVTRQLNLSEGARPLGRIAARELSPEELAAAAGGLCDTTHATGPNGDDPSDPDWNA